jgi:hypothetical protein
MTRDANNDAQRALYTPLSGAEGCGTAARIAHDAELADFLPGARGDRRRGQEAHEEAGGRVIRVTEEAKGLLGILWAPEGEVLRLTRSPGADGTGTLAFRHGRGEVSDRIVQHAGTQVPRIDPAVRKGFDGSTVEVVDGGLGVGPGCLGEGCPCG